MTSATALQDWILDQRWFASKSRDVADLEVVEKIPLHAESRLVLAIVEVRFHPGTHELYQVPLGGADLHDAMGDGELVRELMGLMDAGADVKTEDGVAEFRTFGGELGPFESVRPMGAEQSNSSVVLDDRIVLKAYRRLGAGINPELELLRFLTERGFEHIAPLRAYYQHAGRLIDATLGIAQEYFPGSTDGWDLVRQESDAFAGHARDLGAVTGRMHTALASEPHDPAFSPEETSAEALGLLTAEVDEEIEQAFLDLPEDRPELADIRGRGQEVRERLRMLTHVGATGRVIRHHGDYHLGQVLHTAQNEWIVLDFEGEPARTLPDRRRKRSPLRDVAGMLRSFAYAATALDLPPGWEERMRESFLTGYLEEIDHSLLPPGRAAIDRLLAVFELEKAVYELRYELDNRPDWLAIPATGIARLLDQELGE